MKALINWFSVTNLQINNIIIHTTSYESYKFHSKFKQLCLLKLKALKLVLLDLMFKFKFVTNFTLRLFYAKFTSQYNT